MAKLTTSSIDSAAQVVSGSFTATASGGSMPVAGYFNIVLSGTFVATIAAEYSFDGGTTWVPALTLDGLPATFTTAGAVLGHQPEPNTLARLRCTAYTSGQADWRLSR